MSDRISDDRNIDLRCPACGEMRTPIVFNPHLGPDTILVLCETCHEDRVHAAYLRWRREEMEKLEATLPRTYDMRATYRAFGFGVR